MQVLKDLFSSDIGLLSLGTIVFIIGMGAFLVRFFLRRIHDEESRLSEH